VNRPAAPPGDHPAATAAPPATAGQDKLLRELLLIVGESNPFYQRKMRAGGFTSPDIDLGTFTGSFPFTTKAELAADQRRHPPYGTNLSFPLSSYTRYWQTSGTSAAPIRWLDTQESLGWMLDCWEYMFRAMGITRRDRVLAAFGFGPFLGFWTAYESAQRMGCLCLPGGGMSSEARLRMLADNEVSVLLCTPTYAMRLAEVARDSGSAGLADPVRYLVVAGEPGGSIPATRERLRQLWPDAAVFDQYGMTEIGPAAYQLPHEPGILRVLSSGYIAEVIDPVALRPAEPGATGELVLTNLGRHGSPLLRYRTGDLVRQRESDVPGPGPADFALPGGIIGRVDDMVVVRGVNVYPSAVESVLRGFAEIAEFRVVHRDAGPMSGLEVEVEFGPLPADIPGKVAEISTALRASLSLRVPVRPVPPGSLPRFDMKARRWKRHPS
jgi:phenylacetate-CoA ligase